MRPCRQQTLKDKYTCPSADFPVASTKCRRVSLLPSIAKPSDSQNSMANTKHSESVIKGLATMHHTKAYSDLVIKCGTRTFDVHKAIVCPQSAWFEAACKPDAFKVCHRSWTRSHCTSLILHPAGGSAGYRRASGGFGRFARWGRCHSR